MLKLCEEPALPPEHPLERKKLRLCRLSSAKNRLCRLSEAKNRMRLRLLAEEPIKPELSKLESTPLTPCPMSYTYQYPRPALTADVAVVTTEKEPRVLLIQRGNDPYKGCWAFPGGFMEMDETTRQCAMRELEEETGLRISELIQIGAYSKVDRDPRGRTVTVAYLARIAEAEPVVGQDDAAKASWFPIDNLPPLAFDHEDILRDVKALL